MQFKTEFQKETTVYCSVVLSQKNQLEIKMAVEYESTHKNKRPESIYIKHLPLYKLDQEKALTLQVCIPRTNINEEMFV